MRRRSRNSNVSLSIVSKHTVHDYYQTWNSEEARTLWVVCIVPSVIMQVGYKFLSLATGEFLNRFSWTELSMPDTVARRVEQLETQDRQPEYLNFTFGLGLAFRDLPNNSDNEFENDIISHIFEGVAAQYMEQ